MTLSIGTVIDPILSSGRAEENSTPSTTPLTCVFAVMLSPATLLASIEMLYSPSGALVPSEVEPSQLKVWSPAVSVRVVV